LRSFGGAGGFKMVQSGGGGASFGSPEQAILGLVILIVVGFIWAWRNFG